MQTCKINQWEPVFRKAGEFFTAIDVAELDYCGLEYSQKHQHYCVGWWHGKQKGKQICSREQQSLSRRVSNVGTDNKHASNQNTLEYAHNKCGRVNEVSVRRKKCSGNGRNNPEPWLFPGNEEPLLHCAECGRVLSFAAQPCACDKILVEYAVMKFQFLAKLGNVAVNWSSHKRQAEEKKPHRVQHAENSSTCAHRNWKELPECGCKSFVQDLSDGCRKSMYSCRELLRMLGQHPQITQKKFHCLKNSTTNGHGILLKLQIRHGQWNIAPPHIHPNAEHSFSFSSICQPQYLDVYWEFTPATFCHLVWRVIDN